MLPMLIIGQRLNFAGNTTLLESMKTNLRSAIQQEAVLQEQAGAQALDIHVSFVKPDRIQFMTSVIDQICSVSHLPLSIDDSDLDVVEAGLNRAGNHSFINSPVDMDHVDRIGSLASKFNGAQLLIVPLKQNKTPENLRDFFGTSKKILRALENKGISKERVIIDALLFCLKEAGQKVLETLDRIKILKEEIGVRSVIGLSNISYGLKKKEPIHAYFLKLAKEAGLNSVICDPFEKTVMDAANSKSDDSVGKQQFLNFAESISG